MLFHVQMYIAGKTKPLGWLLMVLLAAAVLWFLQVPEFFLTFCLSGQIPGTNLQISPLAALWISVLPITLAWAVCMEVLAQKSRSKKRHQNRPQFMRPDRRPQPVYDVMSEPDPRPRRVRHMRAALRAVRNQSADNLDLAGLLLLRLLKLLEVVMAAGCTVIRIAVVAAVRMICRSIVKAWRRTMQAVSDVWQWLEPLLWRFDAWLERQTVRVAIWTARQLSRYEPARSLQYIARDYYRSLNTTRKRLAGFEASVSGEIEEDSSIA